MEDFQNTRNFKTVQDAKPDVNQILQQVYFALTEKGYNPINQIVGYIMSGDPTYITSHRNARSLITTIHFIFRHETTSNHGRSKARCNSATPDATSTF